MKQMTFKQSMLAAIVVWVVITIPVWVSSETHYGNATVTKIESVYDGDTLTVTIKEWPSIVYADGVNIGEYLLKNGYAKPYDGGTKEAW